MGTIYGVIYLSPDLVGLDELVEQAGVSKGAVSTNVRTLERLGMVHKKMKFGDRKDYYTAEADMWKIVRGVLKDAPVAADVIIVSRQGDIIAHAG